MFALQFPVSPRRITTAGLVVLIHVAVIYAVLGAVGTVTLPLPPDLIVRYVDPPRQTPAEPPIPQMPIKMVPVVIPAGPVLDMPGDGILGLGVLIAPRLDPRHGFAQPPYPAASVHLGEEGSVTLALLVGADGRIMDARLDRTSGHARLDEAALRAARGDVRFIPGTEDGQPRAMWHRITITFRLDEVRGK